jgi:hypothetical protein
MLHLVHEHHFHLLRGSASMVCLVWEALAVVPKSIRFSNHRSNSIQSIEVSGIVELRDVTVSYLSVGAPAGKVVQHVAQ